MLERWTKIVHRNPVKVLVVALLVLVAGGAYGSGVFNRLSTGNDFQDPHKNATQAYNLSQSVFSSNQSQLNLLFQATHGTIVSHDVAASIQADLAEVGSHSSVLKVTSYYNTGQDRFVSIDKQQTIAAVTISGSTSHKELIYKDLLHRLAQKNNFRTLKFGGSVVISSQINQQITDDLKRAESISFPVVAVLLILIFGNLVAAAIPLILGGLSIVGALFITRLLTDVTTMSAYVINVITLLGLGLAIDYSLFLVGRFREELARTDTVEKALSITVKRAGRTILFSGLTVIISLLSLMVFPEVFLRSMGMSGAAVVATAMLLSITIVPAILRLLGPKINALSLPGRNKAHKKAAQAHGFWYTFSNYIMRYPVPILLGTLGLLLLIGSPFLHATLSSPDIYSTPKSFSSRQVNDALNEHFKTISTEPITIIVKEASDPLSQINLAQLRSYTASVSRVHGVIGVDSLYTHIPSATSTTQIAELGTRLKTPQYNGLVAQYVSGDYVQMTVYQSYAPQSNQARSLIASIRSLSLPHGYTLYTGGVSADLVDLIASLKTYIPLSLLIIFSATIVLIFLLMGGILVPIKAVILGIISLSATFGILVWIFQYGHIADMTSLTSLGSIDATSAVLIFAIAFGLSMDYEFFLLSRVKEEYEKTGDNTHSVAYGVQKTAGIITSAALLLISVISLFTTSKISLIQQIGLGLAVAVAIDSTLVRMILVPTTMRLLGKANWWAPSFLKSIYARFGLHD